MKTANEILDEVMEESPYVNAFSLTRSFVIEAMERYAKQKLLQHGVMQAEASAGAEGAAVGNSAAGKGVCGGKNDTWKKGDELYGG